jgi:hypothetical protein
MMKLPVLQDRFFPAETGFQPIETGKKTILRILRAGTLAKRGQPVNIGCRKYSHQ